MAVSLSIKRVPDEVAALLRERARRNHRSLQGELMAILERAAHELVRSQQRAMLLDQLIEHRRRAGLATGSESVDIIRADRDSDHGRYWPIRD